MSKPTDFQKQFGGQARSDGFILGTRTWFVDQLGRLAGERGFIWRPGENEAVCATCSGAEESCVCGFYAYYRHLSQKEAGPQGAVGIIKGYGPTTVGTTGFRCMKAEIVAVFLQDEQTHPRRLIVPYRQVIKNYPKVRVFDNIRHMYSEFPTDPDPLLDPEQPRFWEPPIRW